MHARDPTFMPLAEVVIHSRPTAKYYYLQEEQEKFDGIWLNFKFLGLHECVWKIRTESSDDIAVIRQSQTLESLLLAFDDLPFTAVPILETETEKIIGMLSRRNILQLVDLAMQDQLEKNDVSQRVAARPDPSTYSRSTTEDPQARVVFRAESGHNFPRKFEFADNDCGQFPDEILLYGKRKPCRNRQQQRGHQWIPTSLLSSCSARWLWKLLWKPCKHFPPSPCSLL